LSVSDRGLGGIFEQFQIQYIVQRVILIDGAINLDSIVNPTAGASSFMARLIPLAFQCSSTA
jgi:hypothetical protein